MLKITGLTIDSATKTEHVEFNYENNELSIESWDCDFNLVKIILNQFQIQSLHAFLSQIPITENKYHQTEWPTND
jgi:hypothetical protein